MNLAILKSQLCMFLVIGLISCNSKSPADKLNKTDNLNVEELERKGFDIFQDSPGEAIEIFKEVSGIYGSQANAKQAGLTNLNIANIYDEYLNNVDSALVYAQKALEIWEQQKDTLQMANLYKYIGLLKGKTGEMEAAKQEIHKAIVMYEKLGFEQGVAVSKFNLADVYFREKNYKESEVLFSQSTDFWKRFGDQGRVFTNNILGIKIYHKIGDNEKVEELIEENKAIMRQAALDEFIITKFNALINEVSGS